MIICEISYSIRRPYTPKIHTRTKYENKTWDSLIQNIQSSTSLNNLKFNLISLGRPKPTSTSGFHDPIGPRYLFQFHAKFSPLSYYENVIALSPLLLTFVYVCLGRIEDTTYFLLYNLLYILSLTSNVVDIL